MLKAARGEQADTLPWAPRFELWYNANTARGTMPAKYKGWPIDKIADDVGGGYHKIIPEWLKLERSPEDNIDRGLGIYRLWGMAFRPDLVGVDREVKKEGDTTLVTYHTPVGSASCKILYNEDMRRRGASITWVSEHILKGPKDYKTVGYIFKNMKVVPDYDNYLEYQRQVGDKGFAAAFGLIGASPMHQIMREGLIDVCDFYLEMYDHPKELRQLCEDMEPFFDQMFRILADSPAEVICHGANYDAMITYPPFFKDHIMPHLQKLADMLHAKGKLLLCHCDGENTGLLELIRESGIDIAEAVTPQPMTKFTITEAKKAFQGKVTILGGVPSVVLMEEAMSEEEFEKFMKNLFKEIAPGDRFILGVADTTPPDAKFERLYRITEMVKEWGKLPMKL
jgi:hypothetical protein